MKTTSDIAVISARCRFPGINGLADYWDVLEHARVTLRDIQRPEASAEGVSLQELDHPAYVPVAGAIDGMDLFDAEYFGYSPAEARVMDVQQRLLLEECASLVEQAGYGEPGEPAVVGVFAGVAASAWLPWLRATGADLAAVSDMALHHGNDKDFVATRIAHKLDLRGPAMAVQTACSSGLVAVHMARQSLLMGECDAAIACAASIRVPQLRGYIHRPGGIFSRTGRCKPLHREADGTVFASGLAAVLLKRMDDAVRDGDEVLAVLKGSAVNNDGASKVGFTAPSIVGQAAVISRALAQAAIDSHAVSFVEMHATATKLGDPLELEALKRSYGILGPNCHVGSVKGNIGHTGHAAGLAGFLKAVLMLRNRRIVPTPGLAQASSVIGDVGRFRVPEASQEWQRRDGTLLTCAVSSFGIGGTNAHALLQEAPAPDGSRPPRSLRPPRQRRPERFGLSAGGAAPVVAAPSDSPAKPHLSPTGIDAATRELFCRLLGVQAVNPNASYFDLGGDSLLAIDLLECVHVAFGVDLPVEALYANSSLAALAAEIFRRLESEQAGGTP